MSIDFSFYPHNREIQAGNISITPLPDIEETVRSVMEMDLVEDRWCYAPPQSVRTLGVGIRERPYSARVFGLSNTHRLNHASSEDPAHLRFLMHCFGFFEGMRMDDSGRGFLDAVPVATQMLNDFCLLGDSLGTAMGYADRFWHQHAANPAIPMTLLGVFQSLALSYAPQALTFEEFLYAYTAIEGCYALGRETRGLPERGRHAERTVRLCEELNIPVPAWVRDYAVNAVDVRNDAIHEGLFLGQPLGFRCLSQVEVPDGQRHVTDAMPAAMRNFVCRVVIALLGMRPEPYLQSSTYHMSDAGIRL